MRLFLGYESTQDDAYVVAAKSAREHASVPLDITALGFEVPPAQALYTRPTHRQPTGYWDDISGAPIATGHAIARFLVPMLCHFGGWAVFADGDVLVRGDLAGLLAWADPRYAVHVVQHDQRLHATSKMGHQPQWAYPRKNWSSVVLWNCGHPANRALTVGHVNRLPGRDLHRFCWLKDEEIGALPATWNYLVGYTTGVADPAIVHFTDGLPDIPGYEHVPFADEWRAVRSRLCSLAAS